MNSIINVIKRLTPNKYIPKPDKTELEELCKKIDKIKHDKLVEILEEVIRSKTFTKKSKEILDNLIKDLQEEGITQDEVNNLIEEAIIEIEDEDIEKSLDEECERYNKFTEANPAEHIYFNKQRNNYMLNYNGKTKQKKNLSELTFLLKEKLDYNLGKNFSKFLIIKKYKYKGKKIIIYLTEDNKAYFDINHVINLLDDLNIKTKKYNECKNKIELYDIRDNKYGGFYIKEFINQETFYNILLHSNSSFAHKFKNDISKILDQLTNQGKMIILNDKLVLVENKKPIEYLSEEYFYSQTYENTELLDFVKDRIINFKKSNWNKYLNKHVLYFFIITLEDPKGLNRIMCKIGYSCDFLKRIKSLEGEYKCKFYLTGMKLIHSVQDEKEFHNLLKKQFPELVVDLKINNHDKDETYVFDIELYKTFLNFVEKGDFSIKDVEIEEESEKILEEYFENIEERYEKELLQKLRPSIDICKIITKEQKEYALELNKKYYEHMNIRESNRHTEAMRDKDIELKKIELEMLKINFYKG